MPVDAPAAAPPTVLASAERLKLLLYGGALLLLLNLAAPYGGLIGLPVTFFLKNKLHLQAHELAQFNLWVGAPLYLSFVFGLLRDRWSPSGAGDRGHLVLFGATTAAIYAVLAFAGPTYATLLAGLLVATASIQIVWSAVNGLVAAIGQQHLMAGQVSTGLNIGITLGALASLLLGGMFSDLLEGQDAAAAARTLFLVAGALMAAIALLGVRGPRRLFTAFTAERPARASLGGDVARLLRHWPIYPALLIQFLWQLGPASGTPLQYHLANTLHASDTQVGEFAAISFGALVPTYVLYGFLCQKVRLSRLMWLATIVAVPQAIPLLFIHSVGAALLAAIPMGLAGGLAQAAFLDLAIRSCPKGLQGTMMMLVTTMYWMAGRFGDVLGTDLYDHHGGFLTAVLVSIPINALILPVLLLAPRSLIDTADGEARAETDPAVR